MEVLAVERRSVSTCPALRRLAWLVLLGFTLVACSPTPTPCSTGCSSMEAMPCVTPTPVAGPPVVAMDLSSDGSHLAILTTQELFVYQVEAGTFQKLWQTPVAEHPIDVAFSPDGKLLVSKIVNPPSFESIGLVWNADTGEVVHTWKYDWPLSGEGSVVFNPDGTMLALALDTDLVALWDVRTESELRLIKYWDETRGLVESPQTFSLGELPPWDVAWSPDGERLAFATFNYQVAVWNLVEGKALYGLKGHTTPWICDSTLAKSTLTKLQNKLV